MTRTALATPCRERTRRRCVAALAVALVLATGCERDTASSAARGGGLGRLVPVDSVDLQESDSVYVGRAQFLTVADDGELFVSDAIGGRVMRFDREGKLRGLLGRQGRGPGEFGGPGAVALLGDSLVVADDLVGQRLLLFRRSGGDFVRLVRREMGLPTHAAAVGGDVWLGHANVPRRTSLARWRAGVDSVEYLLPMPPEFQGTGLEYAHPFVAMTAWSDTILVGHAVHPLLTLADADGATRATLRVPSRARRGVPEATELLARYRAGLSAERQIAELSLLMGAWRLASGRVALLHLDAQVDTVTQRAHGAGWLTVLTPSLDSACVDIPVEAPEEGWPVLAVHGDTLLRIDQEPAEGLRARTVVRRYRVDTDGCALVGVTRGS